MKKYIYTLALISFSLLGNAQCLTNFTFSRNTPANCPTPFYNLSGSEIGTQYYLIDSTSGNPFSGPVAGTGDTLDFIYSISETSVNLQVVGSDSLNRAIDLDGINENIIIPSSPILRPINGITIETWIYPRATNGFHEIYRKEDGNERHLLSFQAGNILAFGIATGGVYQELDVTITPEDYLNQWVHIAATYDGTTKRLYRNGVEIGNSSATGTLSNTGTAPVFIGSSGGVAEFFNGRIDEVRVWDNARDSIQLQNGMSPCAVLDNTGLLLYLKMDDGTGTTITDQSVHNFVATLQQGVTTHTNPNNEWQNGVWEAVSNPFAVKSLATPNTIFVDRNATAGNNTGGSWGNAYLTLTQALNCITPNDTIKVAKGTYKEAAEISISRNITIQGGYPTGGGTRNIANNRTILDGDSTHRIFRITTSVELLGLEFTNGGSGGSALGGAILFQPNNSLLSIDSCQFYNNQADQGGAIASNSFSSFSTITISNSTITNNSASNNGGGIFSITSAAADTGLSSVTITNSTIAGNSAGRFGGGILSISYSSIVTISNSTITNNSAGGNDGGGIFSSSYAFLPPSPDASKVTISNSTIVNNSAAGNGGGIFSESFSSSIPATITISSSVVALNTGNTNIFNRRTTPTIISEGYNIFSDATLNGSDSTDQLGATIATLNLGPLQNNGGTTETLLPGPGSIAIDMGKPTDSTDAQNRNIVGGRRDVGASETTCFTAGSTLTQAVCFGETLTVGDVTFDSDTVGAVVIVQNVLNCDSTVTVSLTVLPALTGMVNTTICDEDSIVINGTTYNAENPSGTEVFANIGPNSCDSTVTINLNVLPALTGMVNTTICNEDSIIINGTTYNAGNPSGTEVFANIGSNSCDSIVTINLNVLPALTGTVNTTLCNTDSIIINGTTYNAGNPSGTEVFANIGSNSCDSIVTINLNVLPALTGTVNTTLCSTDSLVINGTTYNAANTSGTETFTNIGANGCDSTVTISLTIQDTVNVDVTQINDTLISNQVGATYQWIDCGNGDTIIPGATNQSFVPTATGLYAAIVTTSCTFDTSECVNVIVTSIDENQLASSFKIYPNPTRSQFTVRLEEFTTNTTIAVYSLLGKQIINEQIVNKITNVDLSSFDKGIYFVQIQSGEQTTTQRIIKQ